MVTGQSRSHRRLIYELDTGDLFVVLFVVTTLVVHSEEQATRVATTKFMEKSGR